MSTALFNMKTVSNDEVIKKMKYFIEESEYAMEYYQADDITMIKLARELRKELQAEHRNNDLKVIKNVTQIMNCLKAIINLLCMRLLYQKAVNSTQEKHTVFYMM